MEPPFRLLFIGDVIGPVGRAALHALVPELRRELALDAVIANGENAADNGFGITEQIATSFLSVVDFLTLGDHAFDQPEIGPFLDREPRIIRPANFEDPQPGRGWATFEASGMRLGVANLLGTLFMRPRVTSQYTAADEAVRELEGAGANLIVVDLQAEATSEKQAMGWHLAGRVAAALSTHTHTPTADLRILPGGTAYVTDVGMTGASDSIIGFSKQFLRFMQGDRSGGFPRPAEGPAAQLDAVLVEVDRGTGRAVAVQRILKEAWLAP
jgi:2',3'-cyclic-nucleotide 2'-phosphodiesterase